MIDYNLKGVIAISMTVFFHINLCAQDTTITTIEADGPGETYELLAAALGGSPIEAPDCDHDEPFRHIEEVFDQELNKDVFKFLIHKDIDTDRCETNIDRQRNEIKAYDPSPNYLKGILREVVTYEWYFKIDALFQPSSNFTHLFQLKSVGGNDDANPLLTITPRKGDPDQLQLIHGRGNNAYTTVAFTDLDQIKGKWVKVICKAEYADETGKLDFDLTLLDGTAVLSYHNSAIDMWRTGGSFVRPKWGIYRSLNDINSLRDEEVLFADFKITEIGACPSWYEDQDGDGLGDPNALIYACEKPDGYVQNNVDTCFDWYADSDADGLGNPSVSMYSCEQPTGYVDNGTDQDDTINNSVLGITPVTQDFSLYPNPAHTSLSISGNDNLSFKIMDLSGKEMLSGMGNLIHLESLQSGVYLIKMRTGRTLKFIKK